MLLKSLRIAKWEGFGLPRDYWFLVFSVLLVNVAALGFDPFIPLYLSQLGARIEEVGISLAMSRLLLIVLLPFGGYLGDVVGRRNLLIVGPLLTSASFLLLSIAPSWQVAIPALMLSFVPGAFTAPTIQAYIGDVVDTSKLGRAFGTYASILTLATFLGAFLIGLFITLYDYRTMLLVLALWFFLSTVTRLFIKETVAVRSRVSLTDVVKRMRVVLSTGGLRNTIIFRATYLSVGASFFLYLFPILLRKEYGLSEFQIGTIISVESLLYSLAVVLGGKISERGRWRLLLSINLLGQALTIFLVANISSYFLLLLAYPLSSLLTIFLLPITESKLALESPKELRGSVFGALNSAVSAASIPGFWIAGIAWQTVGPYQTLYAFALLIVLFIPASFVLVKQPSGTSAA